MKTKLGRKLKKVRFAIDDMVAKLTKIDTSKEKIGIITIDVFGFSRGAAAARHFVHVVTASPYIAQKSIAGKLTGTVEDMQGYDLESKYENGYMPSFGYLGQLLEEKGLLNDDIKVNIRFVGIYDTVPHHGVVQKNDYSDLGLDNVNRANYVVHMIAADEHRTNFSLVDISSVAKTPPASNKKGGIELVFPGVHCDVGGAYEEGKPDAPKRIEAMFDYEALKKLKSQFIHHGWFNDKEVFIQDSEKLITDANAQYTKSKMRLFAIRKKVSNQYSYIPLHIMAQFCEKKGLPIKESDIIKTGYNFKPNWITDNVAVLKELKSYFVAYSFEGGNPLVYRNEENGIQYPIAYHESYFEKKPGMAKTKSYRLDDPVAKKEALRNLRNHYLHWNSTYGQDDIDVLVQTNYPNVVGGIRKRKIY